MIYISETLRISKLDENCLQMEKFTTVKSKKTKTISEQWKRCGYYGDIKSAFVSALKKQLFDSAEEEIKISEVIARIDSAESNILKAIQNSTSEELCNEQATIT